jgi:hypothetical protein
VNLFAIRADQWSVGTTRASWPLNYALWEGFVPRYVFEVRVAGAIRVRAADEAEARKVVFAVLLLPGPDEVRMANDNNARIGWDGTIASVNSV